MVALDVRGHQLSSEGLAARMHDWQISGTNSIAMIIGGDLGLSHAVLARAALRLSISPMTFTHQMVRLILVEQITGPAGSTVANLIINDLCRLSAVNP